ncbi:hypothetical protein V6Z90_007502 [Aspergillus fumigatus]
MVTLDACASVDFLLRPSLFNCLVLEPPCKTYGQHTNLQICQPLLHPVGYHSNINTLLGGASERFISLNSPFALHFQLVSSSFSTFPEEAPTTPRALLSSATIYHPQS